MFRALTAPSSHPARPAPGRRAASALGHTGQVSLPIDLPAEPMLAKAAARVPRSADGVEYAYEPKWDGFRLLLARDGDDVQLWSRSSKSLSRYFPEVVAAAREHLPPRCVLDAEVVVRTGSPGAEHLDWDLLSQRIHPADSRVQRLATETPAEVIAFDLLALDDEDLTNRPLRERRSRLEALLAGVGGPFHLTATTRDADEAQRWFTEFEGAGLDGIVAKPLDEPYAFGRRTMIKVKHKRTAEAVVVGYRVHKSGQGVGSLLLGLVCATGDLVNVGGISAFTAARRLELVDELAPLVLRDDAGDVQAAETARSRFSSSKDVSFVPLRPERVVEVAFDQLEKDRFRHAVTFLRWRPDRDPASCTLDQVSRAPRYDLAKVLDA